MTPQQLYYQKNKEKYRAMARNYRARPEVKSREAALHRVRKYGMTYGDAVALNGSTIQCEICNCEISGSRICIDHDHQSGKTRGKICLSCNKALGHAKDNPDILRNAADYLEATHYCRS